MPAAAVILAPVAYTKIVAVKKLVVGPLLRTPGAARAVSRRASGHSARHLAG